MSTLMLLVGTRDGIFSYRTVGTEWQAATHALAGTAVSAIVIVGRTLLATVDGVAQQSVDGGATWSAASVTAPEPIGIQVATVRGPQVLANPRLSGATAYARLNQKPPVLIGAGAGGMMLFLSSDDGIHWSPAGMPPAGNITSLIPSPGQPGVAWAGSDSGAILRSNDSGKTWQIIAQAAAPVLCLAAK